MARLPPIEDVAADVRRALAPRLGGGDTRIETIARALATSARSLQRRLAVAGVSYRQLLDLARKEAAERYLRDSRFSIGEVAYCLAIRNLPPSIEPSDDGAMKRRRNSASANREGHNRR